MTEMTIKFPCGAEIKTEIRLFKGLKFAKDPVCCPLHGAKCRIRRKQKIREIQEKLG